MVLVRNLPKFALTDEKCEQTIHIWEYVVYK